MKSRLLAGMAAVVLAILGAVLVVSYAQGADSRALQGLSPVRVLVVTQAVPAGTAVPALTEFVSAQELPAKAVAKSALKDLDGLADKVTAIDLLPGEQLVTERLITPEELGSRARVQVPEGLREISFQLEPHRVVGGRIEAGQHVGIFISLKGGAIEAKPDMETTQLTLHKVLVTAVAGAPVTALDATPPASGSASAAPEAVPAPSAPLIVTVAVNDVDAGRIVYGSEFGTLWLSKEALAAADSGRPGIITKPEVYK